MFFYVKYVVYTELLIQHIAWSMPVLLMAIWLTREGPNWHPYEHATYSRFLKEKSLLK